MKTLTYNPEGGGRYEDTYGGWLTLLREVAESPGLVTVVGPPLCWVSLLRYFNASVESARVVFPIDHAFNNALATYEKQVDARAYVEMSVTARPELVDALYLSDTEWRTKHRNAFAQRAFVVTNTSSFQRPEVKSFMDRLYRYVPTKRKCVLVPCAADKPYPAPLHKRIREQLDADWDLIIATGVLGLVPEALWPVMPQYDSGIPNRWRLKKEVTRYFSLHQYERVVVYCDFYNEAIREGLVKAHVDFVAVNDDSQHYVDLFDEKRLMRLANATR